MGTVSAGSDQSRRELSPRLTAAPFFSSSFSPSLLSCGVTVLFGSFLSPRKPAPKLFS